jgi:hypothetical protein
LIFKNLFRANNVAGLNVLTIAILITSGPILTCIPVTILLDLTVHTGPGYTANFKQHFG